MYSRTANDATSSSHALDYSTLAAIYAVGKDLPTVRLKRELWVKLLRGALGTQFTDSDELFLEHPAGQLRRNHRPPPLGIAG